MGKKPHRQGDCPCSDCLAWWRTEVERLQGALAADQEQFRRIAAGERHRYGITAGELHDRIIADLRAYCEHRGVPTDPLDNEAERPLEQTIRIVCELSDAQAAGGER